MKKILSIILVLAMVFSFAIVASAEDATATLSFADTTNRTSFSTTQQVWEANGIKLTNDKAASTNNVAEYSNPVRFYKNSNVTIEYPGMSKIVITCASASYAEVLVNTNTDNNATITADGQIVTIVFATATDSFTLTGLTAQTRFSELSVYAGAAEPAPEPDPEPGVPTDPADIIDAAYALESGEALPYTATLTGEIVSIDTPYSESYGNITVTIKVAGSEDQPIMCFRLQGEGADALAVGDTITVTGTLKNYNGTIEFDAGCTLDAVVKGEGETPVAPEDPREIVDAAYDLAEGESLPYNATLTGEIVSIDTEYSEDFGNITVTIAVEGCEAMPIMCFRLKGEGADALAVGDIITVTGQIKNYSGTIEFVSGCTLDAVQKPDDEEPEIPTDPADIIDAAYALESGEALPYTATLTGEIVSIDTPYSESYGNITVTIKVAGSEDQPIQCFRLAGEGADALAIGDTITVTGTLKNYNGTIEFDAGCTLDAVVKGEGEVPVAPEDPKEIVDAAYDLAEGESLPYNATLTGEIVSIDTEYSEDYGNITVTIAVEGREDKPIMCFRLKGEGADALAVGDIITVTGQIKNYSGTIEFVSGCSLDAVDAGEENPGEGDEPGEPNQPTGDLSVAGLVVAMMAATAGVVVLKKKEF